MASTRSPFEELIERHTPTLEAAAHANQTREYYAHWQESPSKKFYGETAAQDGEAAFNALLNQRFTRLHQQDGNDHGWHGEEVSPYGFPLGVQYPLFDVDHLIRNAEAAKSPWRMFMPLERAAILVETLERASSLFFLLAYATQHTSGQGFGMAFQATGPHSFERALEVLAMGWKEQTHFAPTTTWIKPTGSGSLTVQKTFRIVPKGIGLVIGCSTFPIWNTLPGLYASLVTGNPVIVKPHPKSVLPIAILVAHIQDTFLSLGLNPHLVQLAPDSSEAPLSLILARHPSVRLIDFTGGAFGNVIEEVAAKQGKIAFTEKAGVNTVILESTTNLDAVLDNIAWTLTLYSGQMCTTSQNFFINKHGVRDDSTGSTVSFDDVAAKLAAKIDALVNNPKMGPGVAGALQSEATAKRVEEARALAQKEADKGVTLVRDSGTVAHADFAAARTASPLLLKVTPNRRDIFEHEWFGPVSFLIPTDNFEHSLSLLLQSLQTKGALTTLVHTTDPTQRDRAEEVIIFDGKAPVAFNYTGGIYVNQSAAYSDFHGAGANPAGTAAFSDATFVTNRFNVIGSREVV
jgi:phenylacetic acid degradation protein paaN